jgi:ATP-dependent Clp protease ATP-binding subunit ClpC
MDRFDRFTDRARQALTDAQAAAARFDQNYIGPQHILLGVIGVDGDAGAKVLVNLGVELPKVRTAVEFLIDAGQRPVVGEVGLTPAAERVIELAIDEARRIQHRYLGTEHLLLGILRQGDSVAASVLESLGVNLGDARREVLRLAPMGSVPADEIRGERHGDTPGRFHDPA